MPEQLTARGVATITKPLQESSHYELDQRGGIASRGTHMGSDFQIPTGAPQGSAMSQKLFSAIRRHDVAGVVALLTEGAVPNTVEPRWPGWRPLHAAINELEEGGSPAVIFALLEYGADINGWDTYRDVSPLLLAICNQQTQVIAELLKAGANPNVRNAEGLSPLRVLVEQGDFHAAALLLDSGATDTMNEWGGTLGYTALGIAVNRLDISIIDLLLEFGADPEALDEDSRTARERLPPKTIANEEAWNSATSRLEML